MQRDGPIDRDLLMPPGGQNRHASFDFLNVPVARQPRPNLHAGAHQTQRLPLTNDLSRLLDMISAESK